MLTQLLLHYVMQGVAGVGRKRIMVADGLASAEVMSEREVVVYILCGVLLRKMGKESNVRWWIKEVHTGQGGNRVGGVGEIIAGSCGS